MAYGPCLTERGRPLPGEDRKGGPSHDGNVRAGAAERSGREGGGNRPAQGRARSREFGGRGGHSPKKDGGREGESLPEPVLSPAADWNDSS